MVRSGVFGHASIQIDPCHVVDAVNILRAVADRPTFVIVGTDTKKKNQITHRNGFQADRRDGNELDKTNAEALVQFLKETPSVKRLYMQCGIKGTTTTRTPANATRTTPARTAAGVLGAFLKESKQIRSIEWKRPQNSDFPTPPIIECLLMGLGRGNTSVSELKLHGMDFSDCLDQFAKLLWHKRDFVRLAMFQCQLTPHISNDNKKTKRTSASFNSWVNALRMKQTCLRDFIYEDCTPSSEQAYAKIMGAMANHSSTLETLGITMLDPPVLTEDGNQGEDALNAMQALLAQNSKSLRELSVGPEFNALWSAQQRSRLLHTLKTKNCWLQEFWVEYDTLEVQEEGFFWCCWRNQQLAAVQQMADEQEEDVSATVWGQALIHLASSKQPNEDWVGTSAIFSLLTTLFRKSNASFHVPVQKKQQMAKSVQVEQLTDDTSSVDTDESHLTETSVSFDVSAFDE